MDIIGTELIIIFVYASKTIFHEKHHPHCIDIFLFWGFQPGYQNGPDQKPEFPNAWCSV
jgi:hypothetical protein